MNKNTSYDGFRILNYIIDHEKRMILSESKVKYYACMTVAMYFAWESVEKFMYMHHVVNTEYSLFSEFLEKGMSISFFVCFISLAQISWDVMHGFRM